MDDLIDVATGSELQQSISAMEVSTDFMEHKSLLHQVPEDVLIDFVDKQVNTGSDFCTDSEGPILQLNDIHPMA